MMATWAAGKQKRNAVTRVPVTTMEEIPVLDEEERAELLVALKKAEKDIKAGKAIEYNPKKLKKRLIEIYRRAKR